MQKVVLYLALVGILASALPLQPAYASSGSGGTTRGREWYQPFNDIASEMSSLDSGSYAGKINRPLEKLLALMKLIGLVVIVIGFVAGAAQMAVRQTQGLVAVVWAIMSVNILFAFPYIIGFVSSGLTN